MDIIIDGIVATTASSLPHPARWLGPIPSMTLPTVDVDGDDRGCFSHGGGEAPVAGGYLPTIHEDGRITSHWGETRLVPMERGGVVVWFVEAPQGRRANRAVNIGIGLLRHDPALTDRALRALGLFKAEIRAARYAVVRGWSFDCPWQPGTGQDYPIPSSPEQKWEIEIVHRAPDDDTNDWDTSRW